MQHNIVGSQFSGGRLHTRLVSAAVFQRHVRKARNSRLETHLYVTRLVLLFKNPTFFHKLRMAIRFIEDDVLHVFSRYTGTNNS